LRPVLKSYADENCLSEHAAILRLIKLGLECGTLPVNTPPTEKQIAAVRQISTFVPDVSKLVSRKRWNLDVQVGPSKEKPGQRLKGSKK
jgi:hypothetical protein